MARRRDHRSRYQARGKLGSFYLIGRKTANMSVSCFKSEENEDGSEFGAFEYSIRRMADIPMIEENIEVGCLIIGGGYVPALR